MQTTIDHVLLPHVGWMRYESGDAVAKFLRQGWFESDEQAFLWLYLRDGDSVVDCGAHAGLFSVLAGKLVGPTGRVVSIEPSPATAQLLRDNLAENGVPGIVFECAAGAAPGTLSFLDEGEGKSAYNHLGSTGGGTSVTVETLDALLATAGVSQPAFLKIDVEGAELDVWAGAKILIDAGALPVVMVEFTEENLRRVGRGTEELYAAIERSGYTLHRFDVASGQLIPRPLAGPIWYENLFAVRPEILGGINKRLREADPTRRQIAWDVVQRGIAGGIAREADDRTKRAAELQAERDAIFAEVEKSREEIARLRLQTSQAQAALDDANRQVAGMRDEREQFATRLNAISERFKTAQADANRNRARLHSFCVSKYERVSWALRIRTKPHWVNEVLAGDDTPPAVGRDATRRP